MLVASAGSLVSDLGLSAEFANDEPELTFGKLEPLVQLVQDTPANNLQRLVVQKLQRGETTLQELITATALANARTFGGEDYVGYHCEMALTPALAMARELPSPRQALPVLKVLYRNCQRLQQVGGRKKETLKPVAANGDGNNSSGPELRDAVRSGNVNQAERVFASMSSRPLGSLYNDLQYAVQDLPMVHRVVLAHRSWELAQLAGPDYAHALLRQCVRYCAGEEKGLAADHPYRCIRTLVPKAMDDHRLLSRDLGDRAPDDKWIADLSRVIYGSAPEQAVEVAAAALAEGMTPDAVAEALTLAANELILRQDHDSERGKHAHGNSAGVHACDAMNAWRHIAQVCEPTIAIASLLVGAYFVTDQDDFRQDPYPHEEHLAQIRGADVKTLLEELQDAIKQNDQARACAAAQRYGDLGFDSRTLFDRLLHFTVSEDGRLHGEKYYRTAVEEFGRTRPAFRWRHAVSLARVTASAYGMNYGDQSGYRAPGYEEACRLLDVPA
jgi:hypothetical protein